MKFLLFSCTFVLSLTLTAQQYKTAIGFKGGVPGYASVNVKHFIKDFTAVEAKIGGAGNALFLQGLLEINKPLQDNFEWYLGGGADLGIWTTNYVYDNHYYTGGNFGLDGLLGIEYTFAAFPLNVAFDMGPTIRVFPYVGFGWGGGFAARFTLK